MQERWIKAKDLIDKIEKLDIYGKYDREQFEDLIDTAPAVYFDLTEFVETIQAAPEQDQSMHARWCYVKQCRCFTGRYTLPGYLFECSNCGAELIYTDTREPLPDLCSDCEAVMKP